MSKQATDKTIRLKKEEVINLRNYSFNLTKKAIMAGHQKIYRESDIVHFLIENLAKSVAIDKNGNLVLNINEKEPTLESFFNNEIEMTEG